MLLSRKDSATLLSAGPKCTSSTNLISGAPSTASMNGSTAWARTGQTSIQTKSPGMLSELLFRSPFLAARLITISTRKSFSHSWTSSSAPSRSTRTLIFSRLQLAVMKKFSKFQTPVRVTKTSKNGSERYLSLRHPPGADFQITLRRLSVNARPRSWLQI